MMYSGTPGFRSSTIVLQLLPQVELDVRDMHLNTIAGKVQKALAEVTGVSVEALKVKGLRLAYGGI